VNEWLEILSQTITGNQWIAPLIALLAGVLTSITPCALSSVPLVIGYVGGVNAKDPKTSFLLSVVFSLGMAITFTVLGTVASLFGLLAGNFSSWWYLFLGTLMVLMALQIWEIYQFIPSTYLIGKNKKKGYFGALLAGVLGGLFSSPCATPVLVVLLSIVAGGGNLLWGILLLLLYSVGHSVVVLISGASVGFVQKVIENPNYTRLSKILKIVMGFAVLLIGLYMFYLGF
jgi:cytochrome c biogenesis protein CcdA